MKTKIKQPKAEAKPIEEAFDKLLAFDRIEEALLRKIEEAIPKIDPLNAADIMTKVAVSHERIINIQRMHRENMESVNGTTRKVVFDCTIIAPREPGDPDAR